MSASGPSGPLVFCTFTNSVVCFIISGSSLFAKVLVKGFPQYKGLIIIKNNNT